MKTFSEYYKDSGLGKWLDEKWVDISRKDKSGKHPPCGASAKKGTRKKGQKKAYPKCRPAAQASSMSSGTKKKAVSQKRRAEGKKKAAELAGLRSHRPGRRRGRHQSSRHQRRRRDLRRAERPARVQGRDHRRNAGLDHL